MKKYELVNPQKVNDLILYQVKALRDFAYVKTGDLGGWIEKEHNLSHEGDCWVYDDATVSGNARVFDNAKVYGNAIVYGNARVSGNAEVFDNARVIGNALVSGNARVFDNALVSGDTKISK